MTCFHSPNQGAGLDNADKEASRLLLVTVHGSFVPVSQAAHTPVTQLLYANTV